MLRKLFKRQKRDYYKLFYKQGGSLSKVPPSMSPVSPVFLTEVTQKRAQSGNIHSIILDVHADNQSTQSFPFNNIESVTPSQ